MKSVPVGRRVSAVVALLAPFAVLAVLVLVLFRRPLVLAGAALCFSLGVGAAAWSRRPGGAGSTRWSWPRATTCGSWPSRPWPEGPT